MMFLRHSNHALQVFLNLETWPRRIFKWSGHVVLHFARNHDRLSTGVTGPMSWASRWLEIHFNSPVSHSRHSRNSRSILSHPPTFLNVLLLSTAVGMIFKPLDSWLRRQWTLWSVLTTGACTYSHTHTQIDTKAAAHFDETQHESDVTSGGRIHWPICSNPKNPGVISTSCGHDGSRNKIKRDWQSTWAEMCGSRNDSCMPERSRPITPWINWIFGIITPRCFPCTHPTDGDEVQWLNGTLNYALLFASQQLCQSSHNNCRQ